MDPFWPVWASRTYPGQGLVENRVQRRLQLLLDVLKQDGVPKLDGVLQDLQVVGHLEVYDLQALEQRTEGLSSNTVHTCRSPLEVSCLRTPTLSISMFLIHFMAWP